MWLTLLLSKLFLELVFGVYYYTSVRCVLYLESLNRSFLSI